MVGICAIVFGIHLMPFSVKFFLACVFLRTPIVRACLVVACFTVIPNTAATSRMN